MLRHVVKKTALAAAEHYLVLFARLLHNIDGFCRHVQVVEHGTRCILSVARWRLVLRRLHVVKVGRSLNYGTALHRHRLLVNILLVLEIHLNRGPNRLRCILDIDKRCVLNGVGICVESVGSHRGLVRLLHALGG